MATDTKKRNVFFPLQCIIFFYFHRYVFLSTAPYKVAHLSRNRCCLFLDLQMYFHSSFCFSTSLFMLIWTLTITRGVLHNFNWVDSPLCTILTRPWRWLWDSQQINKVPLPPHPAADFELQEVIHLIYFPKLIELLPCDWLMSFSLQEWVNIAHSKAVRDCMCKDIYAWCELFSSPLSCPRFPLLIFLPEDPAITPISHLVMCNRWSYFYSG